MGHHEVSDPFGKRRPAARDHMVTVHRLLDRSQLGVRESHVDSVLAGMRHLRPSTLSHRFIDITISENRWNAKAVPITSVTSRFREPVTPPMGSTSLGVIISGLVVCMASSYVRPEEREARRRDFRAPWRFGHRESRERWDRSKPSNGRHRLPRDQRALISDIH